MKKIINGKRYNTDAARKVGEYWNGLSGRDFGHLTETLYQKRTGEYFLHGEGGPMTKYAENIGQNQWSGGEQLIPMSYESARAWAEEKLTSDDYEAEFGEITEDESRKTVTYSLPVDIIAKIDRIAADEKISKSAAVAKAVARY